MSFSKSQGKKQDNTNSGGGNYQPKNQSRGSNNNTKKWINNNNNTSTRNNSNNYASSYNEQIIQDSATVKLMHDRMIYLLANLTGTLVEVTVKDGSKFKGIFHGASTEGDLGIALRLAQKIYDPQISIDKDKTNPNPIKNTLLIFSNDLVEVNAVDVEFKTESTHDRNTFKTDTDISGKTDVKERELHKWTPAEDENNALGLLEGDLEASNGEAWDQFAANEKLFGLKTDFDEEIYTTHLNRSAPGYKDREKRAIQVANEIQKSTTTNIHMLEERGVAIDDSGMDEEDLYGAVVRDTNPNKYVPPALRKQQPPQQQQQQQQQNPQQPLKKDTKIGPLGKLITSDLPKAGGSNLSPIANLPITRRDSSAEKGLDKKSNEPPKRIETEVATTFKHFAMMEKDKLNAKKQALQKKEKDGRLAELKAFHQSFKLNVPIPADLVPLLSKGKKSSENPTAITATEKSEVSKSNATTTTTTTNTTTAPTTKKPSPIVKSNDTSPAPTAATVTSTTTTTTATTTTTTTTTTSSTQSPKAATTATTSTFKFNVKASSFKPNPTAAAFIPGGGHTETNEAHSHGSGRKPHKTGPVEHLTMAEAFTPSFNEKASSVGPTWPFGHKSYRVQFSQFATYEDDVFTGYPSPNYGYGYPPYRYPQYVPGMPQMAVQQGPYINPQFVQNVPITAPIPTGGPPSVGYSPQMTNVSPHGSPFPQGFPSPQRSPMVPPQIYQYQGGPMMMRYPPEMIQTSGGPPVMMQRPVMIESMQYHHQQEASDSGTETPPN